MSRCNCSVPVVMRRLCVGGKTMSYCKTCMTAVRAEYNGQNPRERKVWWSMIDRCHNERCSSYERYGGRGVRVCDRWRNSFQKFIQDVGPKPSPKHSLDRINGKLGYSPDNCRWATAKEQARNQSRNAWFIFNGKKMLVGDIAAATGVPHGRLYNRIRRGMTINQAISLPLGTHMKKFLEARA